MDMDQGQIQEQSASHSVIPSAPAQEQEPTLWPVPPSDKQLDTIFIQTLPLMPQKASRPPKGMSNKELQKARKKVAVLGREIEKLSLESEVLRETATILDDMPRRMNNNLRTLVESRDRLNTALFVARVLNVGIWTLLSITTGGVLNWICAGLWGLLAVGSVVEMRAQRPRLTPAERRAGKIYREIEKTAGTNFESEEELWAEKVEELKEKCGAIYRNIEEHEKEKTALSEAVKKEEERRRRKS